FAVTSSSRIDGALASGGPSESPEGAELPSATGTLEAERSSNVAFPVAGVVEWLAVDEGDAVNAGAVLARLDRTPYRAAVDQAEARLQFLDRRLERSRALLAERAISREEMDADEAERKAAAAELTRHRWNLDRTVIHAPFRARVAHRSVELGEVVEAGSIGFSIIDVDTLKLRVNVSARDLLAISRNDPAILTTPDRPGLRRAATFDHEPIRADARAGTVPILLRVPNEDGALLPGLLAEARFAVRPTDKTAPIPRSEADDRPPSPTTELRVPVTALRVSDEGTAVFRVQDGTAHRVFVEIGPVREDLVVIRRGLSAGDVVVDQPADRLRDGDTVEVSAR
ncbi:MAG: efflux RND transporter periplasmic adaptor subunit, partial [Candidatus Eisenbacteria bacterium]|nr:efflux RND transporter periplasmic adaptor subunit [Candidatus Eisenbacteria bacterium]